MRNTKTLLCFIACLISLVGNAQLSDNFSDGDFTSNPTWTGSTSLFTVNALGNLQSADVVAGQAYIATSFASASLSDREWNFWIKQTFAGSDNNQSRVYLAANGGVLNYTGTGSAGVQGYFLKFGEGGSADAVKLFRDDATGTPIEILSGTSAAIAASFTARIKITRDNTGQWTLYADYTGGSNFVQEATASDNTYSTSTNFGWVCTYTSSNADNFYLDDIYFGNIIVDTEPPALINVTATSASNIDVQFSEAVSAATAEITSAYSIPGTTGLQSSTLDGTDPSLVHLSFGNAIPSNTLLTLTATNIDDLFGNALISQSFDFTYFVPASAGYRDVVFNEILADPSPVVGLPEVEFVELFNTTSEAFDLANWEFINSTTVKILPSYILAPNEYVIITDANNTSFFTNAIGIVSFSALTNDGDSLTLLDNSGTLIDYVSYNSDWFDTPEKLDGGWTLELVNPNLYCQSSANWMESSHPLGGTPNAQNSVYNTAPDTQAPSVSSFEILETGIIIIYFDEAMDINSLASADISFVVGPSISSTSWYAGNQALLINTLGSFEPGNEFQLVMSGLTDCTGNILPSDAITFTIGFEAEPGDIIITEIMADPDPSIGAPGAEYIELYNKSDKLIDLSTLLVNSGTFTEQVLMSPGEYLLVSDISDAVFFFAINNKALMEGFPGLTNTGALITLKNAANLVIDEVSYADSWYGDATKDEGGWALELINPLDPCSTSDNWTASNASTGGTPAAQNSVYDITPDVTAPQIIQVFSGPLTLVTILFDEPISADVLSSITWNVNGEELVPLSSSFTDDSRTGIYLEYGAAVPGTVYNFTLTGVEDCWGNAGIALAGQFASPQAAEVGDIVINEILSNPFSDGSDFIELYNRSNKVLSLAGWGLATESDGATTTPDLITEYQLVLFPGDYIVLTEDASTLPSHYPFTKMNKIWIMENMPTYNNSEGIVVLLNNLAEIQDRVAYSDDLHFAILEDLDGVSLERLDPFRPSTDLTNWHSASAAQGYATPGYLNSQATGGIIADEQITIEPSTFSPDNDGYQDVVTILYSDDTPGLTANIFIFDSNGRQIKHLTKNELLGTNNSISWNGTTEDNTLAPIGIYIIYFEVFSTDGNTQSFKKTCVLAHKLD